MQNQWLSANLAGIGKIKKLLTEMEYQPIYQDLPLRTIQGLFKGFEVEISKLQEQVDQLKKEIVGLKKENENLKGEDKKLKDVEKE